jgi:hypothetical protein
MKRRLAAPLRTTALVASVTVLVAACGGEAPRPLRAPSGPSAEGRPLAGAVDARATVRATALRFARGYLAFQAGELSPGRVPHATRRLRRSLQRLRVPLAQQTREDEVLAANVDRLDKGSARVTVLLRDRDEQLTYPLPLDLLLDGRRWSVVSAGDDA